VNEMIMEAGKGVGVRNPSLISGAQMHNVVDEMQFSYLWGSKVK